VRRCADDDVCADDDGGHTDAQMMVDTQKRGENNDKDGGEKMGFHIFHEQKQKISFVAYSIPNV
jgi:hypothetical protein